MFVRLALGGRESAMKNGASLDPGTLPFRLLDASASTWSPFGPAPRDARLRGHG